MKKIEFRRAAAALVCTATALWAVTAFAQAPIYRCGDSYSQNPCPGGKIIAASDSRSADQKSQTDQAVQRDKKAAGELEKARVKEEAKPAQAVLPPVKPADPVVEEKRPGAVVKPKKLEQFTAVEPKKPGDGAKKKKKKPKKAEDKPA